MKTAATIDVTVPENRELNVTLPPEVPAGKAKLLVMVEDLADSLEGQDFDDVELVEKDGVLIARSKNPRDWPIGAFDHRRIRDERIRSSRDSSARRVRHFATRCVPPRSSPSSPSRSAVAGGCEAWRVSGHRAGAGPVGNVLGADVNPGVAAQAKRCSFAADGIAGPSRAPTGFARSARLGDGTLRSHDRGRGRGSQCRCDRYVQRD